MPALTEIIKVTDYPLLDTYYSRMCNIWKLSYTDET